MNILGISGIEGAIPFKKRHWPGLEEREYRISQGHDSAAALVIDGNLVAAVAEDWRISGEIGTVASAVPKYTTGPAEELRNSWTTSLAVYDVFGVRPAR